MKATIMLSIIAFAMFCLSGCITRQITITSSYPWEHRYTSADKVIVNNEEIKISENGSFWILSNVTLKGLIKQTANSAYLRDANDGAVTNAPTMIK